MVHQPTILVADDEPHIRRILQFLLEQAGYRVVLAEDGREAADLALNSRPDLVLLDVMMPHLDGFSVLQRLRDDHRTQRLPVIMLTAKGEARSRLQGLKGGANDYLAKPFDHEELLVRVSNMLATVQAQREANPLTGLPGNPAIEREVQRRLSAGVPFAAMHVDIDRFKSFNDHYGYARGDRAIGFMAHVIAEAVVTVGGPEDFVGHIGGDDFVIIAASDHAEAVATAVVRGFDEGVDDLHDAVDLANGYLETQSRTGAVEQVDLITVTVALIADVHGRHDHPAAMSDALAELKRHGKRQTGSVVVRERRAPEGAGEPITIDGLGQTRGS
jgi:diguanylate cyclase (GGDEF)-like protein